MSCPREHLTATPPRPTRIRAPSQRKRVICSPLTDVTHLNLRPHLRTTSYFLLALLSSALSSTVLAQDRFGRRYQEPRWLTFRVSEASAGVYAEGIFTESRFENSDTSVSHKHYFIGPSLGLNADGSIYHPNLIRYFILSEGAFGWSHDSLSGSPSREEWDYLGNFSLNLNFLEDKPYHGNAFVNYNHTYRDNDFFTRVTVEGWRYGAGAGWQVGLWNFAINYFRRDETSTSPYASTETNQPSDLLVISQEDTLAFSARDERARGGTSFNYNWNQYHRSDVGRIGQGNDHSFALADTERFGPNDRLRLNANVTYLLRDSSNEKSDEVVGNAQLSADHRDNLSSYYDFNYDHFATDTFTSDSYVGQASLRHQLYESLTSTLVLRGADTETSDFNTSGYFRRFGGGFSESYTKRIGASARVRISNSLFVDHNEQQSTGIAKNERHSFNEGGPVPDSFFLNQANVIDFTIEVTDLNDSQPPLLRDFDYRVTQFGSRTVIERLHPGVPTDVLVDYRALPTPSGSYQTLSEALQIRFEFFKNLLGVYARVNLFLNNATEELRVHEVASYTFGADLTWRWFRAGAEYERYDSSDSDYQAVRLFQSVALRPDEASTVSLNFNQTWIDYLSTDRQEQNYQFINRYQRLLYHRLAFTADAGVSFRKGVGADQVLAVARPSLKYVIGKTTIDAGYHFEYKLLLNNEEREKHMFFIRAKRVF